MKKHVRFRHKVVVTIAKWILIPFYKFKYRYRYKRIKTLKKNQPYLILANHTLGADPIMLSFAFRFPIYFFATEQIFNLGLLSKLLTYAINPISKSKSVSDLGAIRKAKQIIKEGGSIGLFPEGNVTYTGETVKIDPATVKLIRLLKVPVVFYHMQGLYMSNPRWAIHPKKGKSFGYFKKVIEVSEYEKLDDEALYDLVVSELSLSAYEQENRKFRGKEAALGLNRLLFMDLKTQRPNVNLVKNDTLYSTVSDFKVIYQSDGSLLYDGKQYHMDILDRMTKQSYLEALKVADRGVAIHTCEVFLEASMATYKSPKKVFQMALYHEKYILSNAEESIELAFKDIRSVSIQGKKKLIVYLDAHTWLITFDLKTSPYQFLLTYQINLEEKGEHHGLIDISKLGL